MTDPIGTAIELGDAPDYVPAEAPEVDPLEEACGPSPVRPLGRDRMRFYFLAASGELIDLTARELGPNTIQALYGHYDDWLYEAFPVTEGKKGPVVGWDSREATRWLIGRCTALGHVPDRRMRGPGAWRFSLPPGRTASGALPLLINCGDVVWRCDRVDAEGRPRLWRPGRYGGHVYVGGRPQMRPADQAAPAATGEALLDLFSRWAWRRGELDPRLLLGWVGCGYVLGALDWRPSAWISGVPGSGKSTLLGLVEGLLADVLLSSTDSTEAAVRQTLAGSAAPIALDEVEAGQMGEQLAGIMKLVRAASGEGGSRSMRGGSDGTATMYTLMTALLAHSALRPPLLPADLTRLALLDLRPLAATAEETEAITRDAAAAAAHGPALRRRMVDGWGRFLGCLEAFRRRLGGAGHDARGRAQYGTLLAAAWVLARDGVPDFAPGDDWTIGLDAAAMAERAGTDSDAERCLVRLLTSRENGWSGGHQRLIGELVQLILDREPGTGEPGVLVDAYRDLARCGVRVERPATNSGGWLIVSNSHDAVARVYQGSDWETKGSRSAPWVQALQNLPGAEPTKGSVRFAGVSTKAVRIPLKSIPGFSEA